MLDSLQLHNFKNFEAASLTLGPLSLLIGTNASGKSNLRDAFRFLHGIGRGYSLADIIGERYGSGGDLLWRGIRGGSKGIAYLGKGHFELDCVGHIQLDHNERAAHYSIWVESNIPGQGLQVFHETLHTEADGEIIWALEQDENNIKLGGLLIPNLTSGMQFPRSQPILSQLIEHPQSPVGAREVARAVIDTFASMRFLDLNPDALRLPSFPGQTVLGDRGENLSSVLQAICAEPEQKQTLVQWLRELTPMDAVDFEFPPDQIGRIIMTLVENDGRRTTAYSASDGTLRFLGILAALLGPNPARFYFLEELENGIHPTRLHLLLQLIEQRVARGDVQVVATTHSPQLLGLVSKETLEHVSLIYRREGEAGAQIRRLLDLPHAQEILSEESLARLHASGWLEDAVEFAEPVAAE